MNCFVLVELDKQDYDNQRDHLINHMQMCSLEKNLLFCLNKSFIQNEFYYLSNWFLYLHGMCKVLFQSTVQS